MCAWVDESLRMERGTVNGAESSGAGGDLFARFFKEFQGQGFANWMFAVQKIDAAVLVACE